MQSPTWQLGRINVFQLRLLRTAIHGSFFNLTEETLKTFNHTTRSIFIIDKKSRLVNATFRAVLVRGKATEKPLGSSLIGLASKVTLARQRNHGVQRCP